MSDAPPALALRTRLTYGIGAVAFGIKDGGFGFFLLIFYSQVMGLNAAQVGLAITIALVVDAISDPVVGYWTDNTRSRWGRRHPFMVASLIPVAVCYYLLWSPPVDWSKEALFWYLLTMAILVRLFVTLFETPNSALGPELTGDYDQRSGLLSYRFFFGWSGGNLMTVVTFALIFPAFVTAGIANGQFNPAAYQVYGALAAATMFVAALISIWGTADRIPYLTSPPPKRQMTLAARFGEVWRTLADRSFGALFISAMFGAVAGGLSTALSFYFATFLWGFSSQQIGLLTLGIFLSAGLGAALAGPATRLIGKKRGAIMIGLIAFLGAPLPILLKLLGLLDGWSPQALFWFVFVTQTLDVGLIITFQILTTSMAADLVEQAELRTGRRSEGVLTGVSTFIRKIVSGLGVLTAGWLLSLAQFPPGAKPGEVPAGTIWALGALYVPTILTLWMAMVVAIGWYRLDRAGHEETLRRIAERKAAS
jgi:glycoside/pentoside/hexuronide:cation symporter, GPH family